MPYAGAPLPWEDGDSGRTEDAVTDEDREKARDLLLDEE
jgi:hypothetical protein